MSLIFNPRMKPRLGTPINKAIAHKLGLIGCWLFNEAGGGQAFDLSGNGNTGTLVGDTHFVPGPNGPALDFDGTGDYVNLGDKDVFSFLNDSPFSLSVWINTNDITKTQGILGKWNDGSSQREWILYIAGSVLYIQCYKIDRSSVLIGKYISLTGYQNVWLHIVVTYNGNGTGEGFAIYFNGQDIGGTAQNAGTWVGMTNGTEPLYIGAYDNGANNFTGQIDHVMISNRAWSASEVALLYREPFCMFQRELIELWAATSGGAPPAGHPYYYREFANRRIA